MASKFGKVCVFFVSYRYPVNVHRPPEFVVGSGHKTDVLLPLLVESGGQNDTPIARGSVHARVGDLRHK